EIALPIAADCTVLPLHGIEQRLAGAVDLIRRNRLERAAGLNLGGNIGKPLARTFLQARADEVHQRALARGEHDHIGVRRFPPAPGPSPPWTVGPRPPPVHQPPPPT